MADLRPAGWPEPAKARVVAAAARAAICRVEAVAGWLRIRAPSSSPSRRCSCRDRARSSTEPARPPQAVPSTGKGRSEPRPAMPGRLLPARCRSAGAGQNSEQAVRAKDHLAARRLARVGGTAYACAARGDRRDRGPRCGRRSGQRRRGDHVPSYRAPVACLSWPVCPSARGLAAPRAWLGPRVRARRSPEVSLGWFMKV
jgi:hypothetical protein